MTRNADEALEAIVTERGALISSADCTPAEIAIARSCGRFFVREDGMGFVLRPKEWLEYASRSFVVGDPRILGGDVGGEAEVGADDPPAKPLGTFENPYPSAGNTGWQDRRCDKCQWLMHHTRLKGWVCPMCG